MNKAFEKILERIKEKLKKSEERYYRYLDDNNLSCIFDRSDMEERRVDTIKEMLEIVQEVAEEYNGGWIPVSERLPEENYAVLVWCPERKDIYCAYLEEGQWWIFGTYFEKVKLEVIAWMPLPEPFKKRD